MPEYVGGVLEYLNARIYEMLGTVDRSAAKRRRASRTVGRRQ